MRWRCRHAVLSKSLSSQRSSVVILASLYQPSTQNTGRRVCSVDNRQTLCAGENSLPVPTFLNTLCGWINGGQQMFSIPLILGACQYSPDDGRHFELISPLTSSLTISRSQMPSERIEWCRRLILRKTPVVALRAFVTAWLKAWYHSQNQLFRTCIVIKSVQLHRFCSFTFETTPLTCRSSSPIFAKKRLGCSYG